MRRPSSTANDLPDSVEAAGTAASRRIHTRLAVKRAISLLMADGSRRAGTTVDVSQLGLSLSTDKPISPGSKCFVHLEFQAEGAPLQFIEVNAKTVYSSYMSPRHFRIGLVFLDNQRVNAFLQVLRV